MMNRDPFRFTGYPEFLRTVQQIRVAQTTCTYDHRPTQPECQLRLDGGVYATDEFVRAYARFKWAVARVLRPHRIVEIGVGSGMAAFAFLDAVPTAEYWGVDNGTKDLSEGFKYLDFVERTAAQLGRRVRIQRKATQGLVSLPDADLLHVDGGHGFSLVRQDMQLALRSSALWILADDCRWPGVAAAVLTALAEEDHRHWVYFPDTWTGNILIRNRPV